jgi:Flp pilus assembly protein TadG
MQPLDHHTGLRNPHSGRKVTCGNSRHKLLCGVLKESHSGQELAEFAIVIPLLILIAFGVLDIGRGFYAAVTISNAAREGARFATMNYNPLNHTIDISGAVNAAQNEANSSGFTLSSVNVFCPGDPTAIPPIPANTCGTGLPVRVQVSYDFNLVMGWLLGQSVTINRQVEMMVP